VRERQLRTFAVRSAGQAVVVHSEGRAVHHDLLAALGTPDQALVPTTPGAPDVEIWVERDRHDFDGKASTLVTHGVRVDVDSGVVISSVGGSGHAQWWSAGDRLRVCSRWRPPLPERGAAVLLRTRRRAADAQVIVHYPTLWWAGVRGLAPLHAAVVELDGVVVMLAGPGGVGRTTLLSTAVRDGNPAMCDNIAVSDGTCTHGLAEPMRLAAPATSRAHPAGSVGARTIHGRRDHPWGDRPPALVPDVIVTVRHGDGDRGRVRPAPPAMVARSLVAGTFAAGELRRYWPLCAILALATGLGPEAPPVVKVARKLTERVPCLELTLGPQPGTSLRELLSEPLAEIRREGGLP
jgi:hypothetical protein